MTVSETGRPRSVTAIITIVVACALVLGGAVFGIVKWAESHSTTAASAQCVLPDQLLSEKTYGPSNFPVGPVGTMTVLEKGCAYDRICKSVHSANGSPGSISGIRRGYQNRDDFSVEVGEPVRLEYVILFEQETALQSSIATVVVGVASAPADVYIPPCSYDYGFPLFGFRLAA